MKNHTIYLITLLLFIVARMSGQETFESGIKGIASQIEIITKEEKDALKTELEAIDKQIENGSITLTEAESKKKALAKIRAANIESRVAKEHGNLVHLIQQKVDGKIAESDTVKNSPKSLVVKWNKKNKINKSINYEKRTTSQFVFATGLNNLATEGKVAGSDFRYLGSHFYEWGVTCNTRIMPTNNLLHAKYGFSVMYNNLRPTDNRSFVVNGNQTDLVVNPVHLEESLFQNIYLVAPIHLEFDFSGQKIKDGKTYFKTHDAFRFGIGGYAGICLKSKQILGYKENNLDATLKTKGDFNTSNFIYGLSSYVGYKATSLYFKYDLNPLFRNNATKQNNVSLGIRFDLN